MGKELSQGSCVAGPIRNFYKSITLRILLSQGFTIRVLLTFETEYFLLQRAGSVNDGVFYSSPGGQ